DFTLTACAVELGLNVPGHEQALLPYKPDYRPPGLDMTEQECNALIGFLASLPAPSQARANHPAHAAFLEGGEKLFAETGCAACHVPRLGDVAGIYSDLLLHNMGPELADSGSYGGTLPESEEDETGSIPDTVQASLTQSSAGATGARNIKSSVRPPRRSEWRTAPLWG